MHTKVLEINCDCDHRYTYISSRIYIYIYIVTYMYIYIYIYKYHLQYMDSGLMVNLHSIHEIWLQMPFQTNWKGLDVQKNGQNKFQQKILLRTSSRVYLCRFMIFPQNHKKLRKPNLQQNHFQTKPNFGLQLGIQNLKKLYTLHLSSTPIKPPEKKKKHMTCHFFSTTTTSQLPHPRRKNFPALKNGLQRQLRRPLQGNINDRNPPSPGTFFRSIEGFGLKGEVQGEDL